MISIQACLELVRDLECSGMVAIAVADDNAAELIYYVAVVTGSIEIMRNEVDF